MLTFKNTNIVFITAVIILIATDILSDIPLIIFPCLLLLYLLIIFYGCYFIRSGFFMKVFNRAVTDKKEIAISFDDGPVQNNTTQIISILKAAGVKAAFFCIGNRIAGNEDIIKQLHDEGHVIGNHSYTHHFFFDLFSSEKMLSELKKLDYEIKKITGLRPKLFRPPYGVMNPNLRKAILDGDYTPIGWSVRSMDTVIKAEKKLFNKITKAIKPGAVFLLHDTSETMLAILPAFIKHVKALGYDITRLDKMLALQPYA